MALPGKMDPLFRPDLHNTSSPVREKREKSSNSSIALVVRPNQDGQVTFPLLSRALAETLRSTDKVFGAFAKARHGTDSVFKVVALLIRCTVLTWQMASQHGPVGASHHRELRALPAVGFRAPLR
eukprot:2325750-Rhodomonas_salina.3